MRRLLAILGLALVLLLVNWSIWHKEQHLRDGHVVYLELAPVDPRSLIQGDYMALDFAIGNQVRRQISAQSTRTYGDDGYVIASLDERGVAKFLHLDDGDEISERQIRLRYRIRNGSVKFATDAFFFQEGRAEEYESARFGRFRVDKNGDLLLTAMYDETLNRLGGK